MSVAMVSRERSRRPAAERSLGPTLVAIALSLLLIGAGYALKLAVESRTVAVSGAGITAQAPVGWRADAADDELIVRHPSDVHTLYAATFVESQTTELADLALAETQGRAGQLLGFQVLGQQPVRLGDRDGQQVRYAYTTSAGAAGAVELVQAVDVYLPSDGRILALSYQAPAQHFDADYGGFVAFAASARAGSQ